MSFGNRIAKSSVLDKRFKKFLEERNIEYAQSGYEQLQQTDKFREVIQIVDSETAERVRYFPDLIVVKIQSWLVDIKNSKYIERKAYNNYIALASIGYNVGIINLYNNDLIFIKINDLIIINIGNEYYDKGTDLIIPANENMWIAPRELNKNDYFLWKKKHPKASGTEYGAINFKETKFEILEKGNIEG